MWSDPYYMPAFVNVFLAMAYENFIAFSESKVKMIYWNNIVSHPSVYVDGEPVLMQKGTQAATRWLDLLLF